MLEPKIIDLRVHTEVLKNTEKTDPQKKIERLQPKKWPNSALFFDCETTTDELQSITFGCFQYCRLRKGSYVSVDEGLFYADGLEPEKRELLQAYCKSHNLKCLSRLAFLSKTFWKSVRSQTLIVGFNLPFDLSRLASASCWTLRKGGAWSFTMRQYKDNETGQLREDRFKPRIIIKPKDGKGAFLNLTLCKDPIPYPQLRCVDLKTLIWALQSQSVTLDSGCKLYAAEGKTANHVPTGLVTVEEIEYNRQDVRATVGLLNAVRLDFDRHPIDLLPDKAYSPASIAKAYLDAMKLQKPSEKFDLKAEILGIAMQAYYGGRAECRIRQTAVPVEFVDFISQYPTVNTLMGLWTFLTAKSLCEQEATEEIQQLLANLTLDETFEPNFWKRLTFFALVLPSADILPVRTNYNDKNPNIGINPLSSDDPVWYTGPDLIASMLLTKKAPTIIRAIRLIPEGQQEGLSPVALRSKISVDPAKQDFFKTIIEERSRVKANKELPENERDSLSYFLKILANAGSYGLFVEVNPEKVKNNPKTGKPQRAKLKVFAGDQSFDTTSEIVEKPGKWYFPPLASLITAGGRLLLAMLERSVSDADGSYLMCDTDSMAIVASKDGGLVPCVGGSDRMPDGSEAINALSWDDVKGIVDCFGRLNPYNREAVRGSILKIENVNYDSYGNQQQLYGYAIAAKRYALFTRKLDGVIKVEKASAHGLGFLYPPKVGFNKAADAPIWVVEAWEWIMLNVVGVSTIDPSWFELPAMMRLAITTPQILKALQIRQRDLPYSQLTKPFNFVLSPIIDKLTGGYPIGADPDLFTLIAPYTSDPSKWHQLKWVNIHDGKSYRLAQSGSRLPQQAEASNYGDVVRRYRWHPESKSLGADGKPCGPRTVGLLRRTPVVAAIPFGSIGKETDRRLEREEDFSLIEPLIVRYRPNETERLVADPTLQRELHRFSIRAIATHAEVSQRTVKLARRGKRIRRSTVQKLWIAIKSVVNCSTYSRI